MRGSKQHDRPRLRAGYIIRGRGFLKKLHCCASRHANGSNPRCYSLFRCRRAAARPLRTNFWAATLNTTKKAAPLNLAQLMERTQTGEAARRRRPARHAAAAVDAPPRPRAQSYVLLNATDREAFLEQTQASRAAARRGAGESMPWTEADDAAAAPSWSSVRAAHPRPAPCPRRRPEGPVAGVRPQKARELRTSNAPVDEEPERRRGAPSS